MRLHLALEDKKMDTRLLDKKVADGKISKEEANKILSALPDDGANMEELNPDDFMKKSSSNTSH